MRLRPLALFILIVATTLAVSLCGCCCCCVLPPQAGGEPLAPATEEFGSPVPVTILGYDGDAMEPFISRDGTLLLFNNRNDPAVDTNLHYARRINATTFQYAGEIAGANSGALDGVPSLDRQQELYFTTTRSYETTLSTIYTAKFADGAATGVAVVGGIAKKQAGWLNMDAEISTDGRRLYYTVNEFVPGSGLPKSSDIAVAEKKATGLFEPLADSGEIMKNVNTGLQEYAPATSAGELELYFTRADFDKQDFRIMVAKRNGTAEPFGLPGTIASITGTLKEAPTLSPDGQCLYYHLLDGDEFRIYMVQRLAKAT